MDNKILSPMSTTLMLCKPPSCLQCGKVMQFDVSETAGKYYGFIRLTCSCGCVTKWQRYPLMNASIIDMSKAVKAAIASRRIQAEEAKTDDKQQTRESACEVESE